MSRKMSGEPGAAQFESATSEDWQRFVAEAAYYRAERRGFAPGGEVEDWLEAEREILALRTNGARRPSVERSQNAQRRAQRATSPTRHKTKSKAARTA